MEDDDDNSCSKQMTLKMEESSTPLQEPVSEDKCLQADTSENKVEKKSGSGEAVLKGAVSGNDLISLSREEKPSKSEVMNIKEGEGSEPSTHVGVLQQDGSMCEVAVLQMEVEKLQEKLKACEDKLQKVQKQLSISERLHKRTENYNLDLRLQVEKLSVELHHRKRKEKYRVEAETQTEEYTWTETDYYNYYYGGYYQTTAETTGETEGTVLTETQETSEPAETYVMATETAEANQQQAEEMNSVVYTDVTEIKEVGDCSSSIADMLRATAEEAVNQTGFVFDESSGLYYDHATGFYYDSNSQLYYDNNTGMYYYYDTESGKYQFHSRIELPTVQSTDQPAPTNNHQEKINKKKNKKVTEKAAHLESKDLEHEAVKYREERSEGMRDEMRREREKTRKEKEKTKKGGRSRSRNRKSSDRSGRCEKRRRRRNGSHSDDGRKSKKKKEKGRKKSKTRDESGESEPEEGEIEPSSSSSSSSSPPSAAASPAPQSPVIETKAQEEVWPPCVRVTVVRSPVLQTGTLFILTADSIATIGREKDINHAIRIPEMGVSKSHAEVYFDQDQQCYMLVDQGSQNGTVINGNRILQPKVRCDPCTLTHGDEVKLGETVLSFHIHSGTDTCDGCEPGQVRAHLSRHRQEDNSVCVLSKEEKELQRQKELKQIKIKYGLKNSDYEDSGVFKNCQYKDRAESRRQTVGSEGNFHRDDAPASLHTEISEENKGRQMLEKMGWKSGEGLGKDSAGITEPIGLQVRPAQSGLGSVSVLSPEDVSLSRSKKQQNWERARERFSQTQTPKTPQAFVKGQPAE